MAYKYWCYCVSLLCILQSATSFNLEPRIPVIKYGKPGSYFGFSVAEHMTVSPNANTSWLLVGAPLDQNRQPNTTKSGALWKCPLTPAVRDCDQVVTDGKQTMDSDHLLPPDEATEIKNGQWLGVSVRSQGVGQKAVVCAHRYIRKDLDLQHGQGLCYTFSNDLQVNDVWESCRGRSVRREHEEFGLCQVGTSSSLLADNTLILGSPGPFTWRGTIFVHDSNEDLINRQYETYMGPVQDGFSPVEKYSYLGMSVTGAKFFSGNFSYASGAPRARGTGQVVIFSKQTVLDWSSDDVTTLNVSMILNGEQFGSSYGYEVAAGDVNGDGYPDLLVGAPFYFSRDAGGAVYLYLNDKFSIPQEFSLKLTGKPESQFGISIANAGDLNKDGCEDIAIGSPYEGDGVVYIHMGDRKNGLHSKPDQIIRAEHLPRKISSFGYSLSGGMDLDANGYPDLLAGAYENSTVVLLRARPIIDIKTAILPSNTILNVDPLTQGCEQDPESNYTCFHFEACCSIKSLVKSSQSNMHKVNYVIEAETFPGGRKYSRVFFGSNPTARKSHIVDRTFDLRTDVEECKRHIVYLKNSTRDIQTPIKFQLSYKLVHAEPRYTTVGTLPSIDEYPVLNATSTTTFTANFLNDCGSDGICISDLVVTPKLLLPKAEDGFNYALTLGQDEEIKLAVFVDNYGESAYEAQLIVQHPASLHYIAADITDKHVICTSMNDTVVTCMLENPFKQQVGEVIPVTLRFDTIALDDHEPSIKFIVWANSTSKEKNPGKKPEQAEALVIKNAELSIKGVARPEQVFYGGDVKGETAMAYFDDIGPRVMHTYQVFNEGPWHVSNVRVVISWPHQVAAETSQGKWLLYPEDIPSVDGEDGNINGECFGTKSEINTLGIYARPGTTEAVLENLEMDPFQMFQRSGKIGILREERNETVAKYDSAAQNKLRRKRDLDVITAEAYTDKDGHRKQIVNMNCQNKTAKCIQFQCVIYRLSRMQAVTITVKARLWNSTLVEDYPRVGHVNIASSAYIHPPDNYNIHQNKRHDDSTTVETVAYPDLKISEPSEVPLWVIIVSVIVGLIVLVLLIIALWKLGFFKRSRPDPTLSGNLEKNNHEASPFIVRDRNSFR